MKILPPLDSIDRAEQDREPTDAELNAIETEMPLIAAEVELLDVRISLMDRMPSELDHRRLRRARNKVLCERAALANRSSIVSLPGGAA